MTRPDTVIKKADKGSATVIMSREDYINNVRSHLDNRDHYLKPNDDLTQHFSLEIKEALIGMAHRFSIPEELISTLLPDETKVSRYYIPPKIHEYGNPGRPIV